MKKILKVILTITMMISLLAGCGSSNNTTSTSVEESNTITEDNDNKIKIGIIQPVEHPSLNQIREYIILGLEEQGLKDQVEIIYKDAQGDSSNINTIVSQFVGDKMDFIVPIGTGTAQAAASATKDIPIVFAAVSYPIDAGLVKDLNNPEANITGVSDAIDVEQIFNLVFELTPDIKTFGLVYNSGEVNSVAAIENAKEYLEKKNIKVIESTITNSSELLQATQSLVENVDAIFTPTDNTVASAMPVLSSEAIKAGIPVYTGADSMVEDGGLATIGVDYKVLGRQVATMIKSIIDGKEISDIPIETLSEYSKIINITTAEKIGLELTKEEQQDFTVVE